MEFCGVASTTFDNKSFIVKAWSADMEFTKEEVNSIPIWVRLLSLDLK